MEKLKTSMLFVLFLCLLSCSTLEEDWRKACKEDDEQIYWEFMVQHPKSRYYEEAKARYEARKKDKELYYKANKDNTVEAYEAFLKKHPDSYYKDIARKLLEDRRQEREVATQRIWEKIKSDKKGWESEKKLASYKKWVEQFKDKKNRTEACLWIGDQYLKSIDPSHWKDKHPPEEADVAKMWYEKVKDAKGQEKLGELYYQLALSGRILEHTSKNGPGYRQIEIWLQKASDLGNAKAQGLLGSLYFDGLFLKKDYQSALVLFKSAASKNNPAGLWLLGVMYRDGLGVKQEPMRAIELLLEAVEMGSAGGMMDLGVAYQRGIGVTRDEKKAVDLFQKAIQKGYRPAKAELALAMYEGKGIQKNPELAFKLLEDAAKWGDQKARYRLVLAYRDGDGVKKNPLQAKLWCQALADEGHAQAKALLPELEYKLALGRAPESQIAMEANKMASDAGVIPARFRLAEGYEILGEKEKAMTLYKSAADAGDGDAQFRMGLLCEFGEKGLAPAHLYYQLAANQGHGQAQFWLGRIYEFGCGVKKDPSLSKVWYEKAAAQGHQGAKHALTHTRRWDPYGKEIPLQVDQVQTTMDSFVIVEFVAPKAKKEQPSCRIKIYPKNQMENIYSGDGPGYSLLLSMPGMDLKNIRSDIIQPGSEWVFMDKNIRMKSITSFYFIFDSDPEYPLLFRMVEKKGLVYIAGRGTITREGGDPKALGQDHDFSLAKASILSNDPIIKQGGAWALGWLAKTDEEKNQAMDLLANALKDPCFPMRRAAMESMMRLGGASALAAWIPLQYDPDPKFRRLLSQFMAHVEK